MSDWTDDERAKLAALLAETQPMDEPPEGALLAGTLDRPLTAEERALLARYARERYGS